MHEVLKSLLPSHRKLREIGSRFTEFAIGGSGFSAEHTYDGFNRLIKTDATVGQTTTNYEHVYAGKKHLGNIDVTGTPVNPPAPSAGRAGGKVWRWEGGAISYQLPAISSPKEKSRAGESPTRQSRYGDGAPGVLGFLFFLTAGSWRLEAAPAPQRSTASGTQFYALNDERNMQRKSYRVG